MAFIFFGRCGPFRLASITDNPLKINPIQTHLILQQYLSVITLLSCYLTVDCVLDGILSTVEGNYTLQDIFFFLNIYGRYAYSL